MGKPESTCFPPGATHKWFRKLLFVWTWTFWSQALSNLTKCTLLMEWPDPRNCTWWKATLIHGIFMMMLRRIQDLLRREPLHFMRLFEDGAESRGDGWAWARTDIPFTSRWWLLVLAACINPRILPALPCSTMECHCSSPYHSLTIITSSILCFYQEVTKSNRIA